MMEAAGKGLGGAQSALAVIPIAIANCAEKSKLSGDLPPLCAVLPLLICTYSKYNPLTHSSPDPYQPAVNLATASL